MSRSSQDGFLNFSQGENNAVTALTSHDGHSGLLMDNSIIDAFLSDLNFQSAPDEGHSEYFSGQILRVLWLVCGTDVSLFRDSHAG
jgi:hypothetical protein